jgi:glycosyltransferase involved in cell wall biosynthesis
MIDVILPVLDEAGALPWVLARMPAGYRAIVVDNGSTDGSATIARRLGATVVEERQRGFGAACFAGLAAATTSVVCFMDSDATLDPTELPSLTAPVLAGEADLVIGRRRPDKGSWPIHARIANAYLARAVTRRTGIRLHDLGPMRATGRTELLGLGLRDRRSGWPLEMVLVAGRAGWRLEERSVRYLRRTGRSKVTGTARGTIQAIGDMRAQLAMTAGDAIDEFRVNGPSTHS